MHLSPILHGIRSDPDSYGPMTVEPAKSNSEAARAIAAHEDGPATPADLGGRAPE
jgi:hypothetical protein